MTPIVDQFIVIDAPGRMQPVKKLLMIRSKKVVALLFFCIVLLASGDLLINECFSYGGMGASYKSCDCAGFEWVLFDQTAADGPRKTICIGIIRSTACYRYIGGPAIECNSGSQVSIKTDKQVYDVGEYITVVIENKLTTSIRYYGFCSWYLCNYFEDEWYCEMKDCYSPETILEPGSSIVVNIQDNLQVGERQKYRFEFQTFTDDTLYTVDSNEFTVTSDRGDE